MTLLISLTSRSLQSLLDPAADPPRTLLDAPAYVRDDLGLRGLSLDVEMLAGWSVAEMDDLRRRADQTGCPCLLLVERTPLAISAPGETGEEARDRLERLAHAAHRLGCNSLAISVGLSSDEEALFVGAVEAVQAAMLTIERLELNLLIAPGGGVLQAAERLSEFIKQVGGFRIGAMPTYGDPDCTDDAIEHIRHLAPYAGAVHLRCEGFKRGGAHRGLDLAAGVMAAKAVGYQSNLVIDYLGTGSPAEDIARAAEVLQAAIDAD